MRRAMLIDGTGAPLRGPVDIFIDGNRIDRILPSGSTMANVPIGEGEPPATSGREMDLDGFYVLPGLMDLYAPVSEPIEYGLELWLAHGITTIREPFCSEGIEACLRLKEASSRNERLAPRIFPYLALGLDADTSSQSLLETRDRVAEAAQAGASGVDLRFSKPTVLRAALEEALRQEIGASVQLDENSGSRLHALDVARWGGGFLESWHGLPEALLPKGSRPAFSAGYDPRLPKARSRAAVAVWNQAGRPGTERWLEVIDALVEQDLTLIPALSSLESRRDLMRARRADWHDAYTLPSLWRAFGIDQAEPWSTEDEVAWRGLFSTWMAFLNDFKDRGGRVVTGSGAGRSFNLYGFGLVRELELLQEAGFEPMEALLSATSLSAEALGMGSQLGTVESGKLADLIIVKGNPLVDFKILYGATPDSSARAGKKGRGRASEEGIRWTVKDGILYEVPKLLAGVRQRVGEARERSR
ncbi:MAG: amidohydrolase family protein [Deltaproteobacteria bacterium]|nr:amidohydrolase family protein [Deltaproteobacteria bacterium]